MAKETSSLTELEVRQITQLNARLVSEWQIMRNALSGIARVAAHHEPSQAAWDYIKHTAVNAVAHD